MKSQLMSLWLYIYLSAIYFVPLIIIMRSRSKNNQFLLRKMLFPLEYLIQVRLEQATNFSRSAIRLGHIFIWVFSIMGLLVASFPLYFFHEPYKNHSTMLLFIAYYFMLAPIFYWFQPRNLEKG